MNLILNHILMWNYLLCKSGLLLLLGEMGLIHMRLDCLMRVCVLADCHAETETQRV